MKLFDSAATRAALPFDALIAALEAMFVAGCEVPARHVHAIAGAGGEQGKVLIMPAWQPGGYMGIKTVNIFPGNAARGMPGLFSTYILYDAATGEPLAQIDGNEITSRRTAAASALAARYLAREDAGQPAGGRRGQGGAPAAARLPRGAADPRGGGLEPQPRCARCALAAELAADGFDARASDDLEAAARQADIVSCATLATEPVIRGEWLQAGSHLDLIGSFTPQMREADDACFAGARLFVDTAGSAAEVGRLARADGARRVRAGRHRRHARGAVPRPGRRPPRRRRTHRVQVGGQRAGRPGGGDAGVWCRALTACRLF